MNRALVWLAAARPRTLPAAVAPVMVGCALAMRENRFVWGAAALCLAFALLIQIGTNFANDYYDFIKGADTAARVGPRRAVAAGLVSPGIMKVVMIATFAAAFGVGLCLLPRGGLTLLVVGLSSIAAGIAYTGGPWPLGYLGLGDVFVFVFFGPVAVMTTCFVQTGNIERAALLTSIPIGLLAANILLVNNYRDADTDGPAGKRTLVVRFGRGFARGQYACSLAVALLVPIALLTGGYRWPILLPLLATPLGVSHARRLAKAAEPKELIALLGDSGKLLFLYGALLATGLVWSR
ncbi:MAG TPA: 1,4-dihydroxy-2-naphthoate polyprenyltransferase [Opitutaceae bacterium]|jgi:1,4-dihydroxy-2-naphthoate octaprenyltransferase